jgi:AcrR family transcriptional regulator
MRVKKRRDRFPSEEHRSSVGSALLETIALLWEKHEPARRGPKPSLDRAAIIAKAIAIADAHGIEALSMQRLASHLGFTTMSLYRYVRAKTDLVDLMIEHALGECPAIDDPALDWRARMEQWALSIGRRFVAHPWSLAATAHLRIIGPNELSWMNTGVRILTEAGLSGEEAFDGLLVIIGHVRTVAHFSFPVRGDERSLSGVAWLRMMHTILEQHGDRFAAIRRVMMSETEPEEESIEDAFLFGLRCILDGLSLRIASDASR